MYEHIHQSNLIEGIDDPVADSKSVKAWEWLKDQPQLSHGLIQELQGMITKGQLEPPYCGKYRRIQVYVGTHQPPMAYAVPAMVADWLYFVNMGKVEPKIAHIQFEGIHPFVDGNGRTGRMLMWWHERRLGKEPTLIKASERQQYYQWFKNRE